MRANPTWHGNATGRRRLKPKTKRGLGFLIFALIAFPVIKALSTCSTVGAISRNIESHAGATRQQHSHR